MPLNTISRLVASDPQPSGNADTITNSLAPFANASVRAAVFQAASTGIIPPYNEPSCAGAGISPGDYGTAIAAGGLKAIPVVGGLLSAALGAFGAHHAAAVKLEQATLCSEVPGIQNLLAMVDQAVRQGADLGQATAALESGYQTFVSRTQKIFKSCNAACDYQKYVRAAIEYRKQNYALIAAQNAAGSQGVIGGVVNAVTGAVNSLLPSTPGGPATVTSGVAAAGILGGGGFSLNPAQAKLAIIAVIGFMFVGGLVFIANAKKGAVQQ
jgi:hypothetical protein